MRINVFVLACFLLLTLLLTPVSAAAQAAYNEKYLQGWAAYETGNFTQAMQAWLPLAHQGDASAQLNLGALYDNGQGVSEDAKQAWYWYHEAAKQGKAKAQFNLGIMYATGRGIKHDASQASRWYYKAAEQGLSDAQFNLALQFSEGFGVVANAELANQWLYRAGQGYLAEGREQHVQAVILKMNTLGGAEQLSQTLTRLLSQLGPPAQSAWENASVGTAWPIAAGYVVTNDHVIGESKNIVLITPDGREIAATIVARSADEDLALLSVHDPSQLPPALQLSKQLAKLGTSVFTIGFPRIDLLGKTPKLSAGLISSVNGMADDISRYQLSLAIQPGNSGGPLINMQGEVVGVITSMLGIIDNQGNTTPLANISYAVKINSLLQLLSQLPEQRSEQALSSHLLAFNDPDLESMADRIQHSVLIVRAK